MKRLLCMLCFAVAAWGALPAGAQWEVRTTGNDLNGGFFNTAGGSGTDYSQQNSAQLSLTDGVTVSTSLTSVTGGFTAAMVHNGVQISGGTCTAGIYEITAFTSTHTVTIDRSGGSGTGCTINVGGGLATPTKAVAGLVPPSVAVHNTIWIQSGTYTLTTTLTWPNNPTPAGISGYAIVHGDNGTKPLLTTATNSTPLLILGGGAYALITDLSWSNTASVRAAGITTNNGSANVTQLVLSNCIFDGFSNGIVTDTYSIGKTSLSSLEVKNSTGAGILITTSSGSGNYLCSGCYIHNNAGAGLENSGAIGNFYMLNSIVASNGASGVLLDGAGGTQFLVCENSDFVSNTGAGVAVLGGNPIIWSYNSVFYGNTTYGINVVSVVNPPATAFGITNAYGANGTAATLNFPAGIGDVTLTANPFTSSTNFALNKTAGGGAALRGVGFPGVFQGGTTTGYPDVGAVQSQAGGGQVGYSFVQ